jgi:DUF971 family protein
MMRPTHITQVSSYELKVVWEDGDESLFTTTMLRTNCPCASCVQEKEENRKQGLFSLPIANQTELRRIELSGHNAMIITWGDGHKAGIYTWEYLRSLVP